MLRRDFAAFLAEAESAERADLSSPQTARVRAERSELAARALKAERARWRAVRLRKRADRVAARSVTPTPASHDQRAR